ncbi:chemotaxis-specific protein-glutamate methyltransferase CheB [Pelagerythrobacter rhizovicinus]|uniref:protein-glutamate methylesterase n=2 Tax=Pelagerythrobacter rhizovicinus TaxID=2268576 RepID=A0A4Q2KIL1_9SPHN|nr:chemotaxis-specific protein-glutamate methyltransferase CheB [Pelagerythrobacter rhizovicinus]
MIVDDSLTVRAVLSRIIAPEGDMAIIGKTGSAENALAALAITPADVVLLDLEMPGMGGLHALPKILAAHPGTQVLVVSSLTEVGAEHTLAALSMGAADTMLKPRSGEFDESYRAALLQRIRALGRRSRADAAPASPAEPPLRARNRHGGPLEIIGIGASTGGIHALCMLLRNLPRYVEAPILVTQHLPRSFMHVFAGQLELASGREAVVVDRETPVESGRIHIAPGDGHLLLRGNTGALVADRTDFRAPSGCMPSVDSMFESMAGVVADGALGVVLSGMGRDGLLGAERLVQAGGNIIAQDEASSSVWGMPRAVVQAGLASAVLPPEKVALRIALHAGEAAWR